MKNIFGLGLGLVLTVAVLSGCSGSLPSATENLSRLSVLGSDGVSKVSYGKGMKGGKGGFGKEGKGGAFGFFPAELNLTDDQKVSLEAIRKEYQPAPPADNANATKTGPREVIKTAFVSDNFDVAALKTSLEALKPVADDARLIADANVMIKSYNVLTAEQKQILETKAQEMAAKVPEVRPSFTPDQTKIDERFTKLATDLGLNDTQKSSLKDLLQPSSVKPDMAAEQAKHKASHDAINAELKSGNATVESIIAILKANKPVGDDSRQTTELDRLAKIHAILTADQRTKFMEIEKGPMGGPGGPGGHGMKGGFGPKQ